MPKAEKYPTKAQVTGKEKRQKPTKHYVFIVQTVWSDGSRVPIYRQYSEFHQLHTDLQEFVRIIPESEAKVSLPVFPAKRAFERAEISKAASVRRHAFDGYCKAILDYDILAKSKIVGDFFLPKTSDINPVTEPEQTKRRSSLFTALAVLLPKKDEDKKGTLPKSKSSSAINALEAEVEEDPVYVSSPLILESYLVLADYTPQEKGEVILKEDHIVQVVEKHTNGWWFLSTEYGEGWGPATHLQALDPDDTDEPDPIYSGSKYITTNSYTADSDAGDEISFPEGAMVDVLHKLMDGWWVIKYQGEVGYAPATYLAPFKNPHYRDSRYGQRQNRRPTKRKSTIKNSKGQHISASVRDKSRDLVIYKKLSGENSPGVAAASKIAKKTNSVRFQEPQDTGEERKAKLHKTVSNESYEYIDEDEMEDITTWVDENVLRKKQEEQGKKHDYVNVPTIVISDDSGAVSAPATLRSQSEPQGTSDRTKQSAPLPPAKRTSSAPELPYAASKKNEELTENTSISTPACTQAADGEEKSLSKSGEEKPSRDEDFRHPEEIDEMLTLLRRKRISRMYMNEQGELVIKFTNPDDIAAFGFCDVRDNMDSCPMDPEPATTQKPKHKPLYSKVNKKKRPTDGAANIQDGGKQTSKTEDNNNQEKKKSSKSLPKFSQLDDEFAIYV